MKLFPCILRACVVLAAGLACQVSAQVSRAFPDGTLVPGLQARPSMLAAAADSAVIVPPFSKKALVYERSSGVWSQTQSITGNFTAAAMNSTGTQFALAHDGQIDLYNRYGAGSWGLFGNAYTSSSFEVLKVAFEGDRVAALIDTQGHLIPGGMIVRIFEYNAADWEMVKQIAINSTEELVEVGNESVISDFSIQDTRLVLGSRGENVIRVLDRNQSGSGQWGLVKEISGAANGATRLGEHLTLSGSRIAASARAGTNQRLDVFSVNAGGTNNWGYAGSSITVPTTTVDSLVPHADPANGYLGVFGLPPISSATLNFGGPVRTWVFRNVLGGGPGNWLQVADFMLSTPQGFPPMAPGIGFSYEDLLCGLPPSTPTGVSSSWVVPVFRRSTGGTDGWQQQQLLSGPGTATQMGKSIATDGQFIAVGMPDDGAAGAQTGSVMVWYQAKMTDGSVWIPTGRFEATTPVAGARFGESVAIYDGGNQARLAVGAPGENGGRGAVYIFDTTALAPVAATKRVVPSSALDAADGFGTSVSFRGSGYLAVGCPGDDDAGSNAGAAYVFERDLGGTSNWGQRKKILRPAGETLASFGKCVAFTIPSLFVSLPSAATSGKIFAFREDQGGTDNWGQFAVKTAPAGSPIGFPASLGTSSGFSLLAAGAPSFVLGTPGKAYLLGLDDSAVWTEYATFGGTAAESGGFGTAVACYGGEVAVGDPFKGSGGKSYTYNLTGVLTWSLLHTRDGATGDALGTAVGLMPGFTFSAAPWSDLGGTDAGAVFVERSGPYELWAANQGAAFTQWYPEQDPDGDGLKNLEEFGMGGNPMSASSRVDLVMTPTVFTNSSTSFPAMRWNRPSLPYSVSGLTYQMRRSANLVKWVNATADGGLNFGDPPGLYYRITGDRGFFRIEFHYPEISDEAVIAE